LDLCRYQIPCWHPGHLRVFATSETADEWLKENDPEGVTFEYEVIE
jgi:hypothetical protein